MCMIVFKKIVLHGEKDAQKREHLHCIGFFWIAVTMSLDEWK